MQPKPCLSPRKRPAGTDPTQQLQRWGLVATREGPGLKAPKPTALHHPSLGCLGGLRGLPESPRLCAKQSSGSAQAVGRPARASPADRWWGLPGCAVPGPSYGTGIASLLQSWQSPGSSAGLGTRCQTFWLHHGARSSTRRLAAGASPPRISTGGGRWGLSGRRDTRPPATILEGPFQGRPGAVPGPQEHRRGPSVLPGRGRWQGARDEPPCLPSPSSHSSACIWGGRGRAGGA